MVRELKDAEMNNKTGVKYQWLLESKGLQIYLESQSAGQRSNCVNLFTVCMCFKINLIINKMNSGLCFWSMVCWFVWLYIAS